MTLAYSFQTPTRAEWRERFRTDLATAMKRRRVTHKDLSRAIGTRHQTISDWLTGRTYPLPDVASRLADALDAPHLAYLVIAGRTITCELCGATSVASNKGGSPKIYCGIQCKSAASDRRQRGVTILESHLTRHRLRDHQEAVASMCRECTLGEGLCEQWQCPLRRVSPIPLSLAAQRERDAAGAR